jgi:hypothetical protein
VIETEGRREGEGQRWMGKMEGERWMDGRREGVEE